MFAFLTVRETLELAERFFGTTNKADLMITSLGLKKCENTIVGNERARGISGGEKKRLNVAIEMIKNPRMLFLDEPTTGLDSFQALSVVIMLKSLAK